MMDMTQAWFELKEKFREKGLMAMVKYMEMEEDKVDAMINAYYEQMLDEVAEPEEEYDPESYRTKNPSREWIHCRDGSYREIVRKQYGGIEFTGNTYID
jgi:uncharacterized protein YecT (DUF1311 family)